MRYTSSGEHLSLAFDTSCREDSPNRQIHLIVPNLLENPEEFMDSVKEGFEKNDTLVSLVHANADMAWHLVSVFKNQYKLDNLGKMLNAVYYPKFPDATKFYLEKGSDASSLMFREWNNLDLHRRNILLWMMLFADCAQEDNVLVIAYPEFSLPLRFHHIWFNALQCVLESTGGAAVVMTESPLLLQNVPSDCLHLPIQTGSVYAWGSPAAHHFAENTHTLLSEVVGIDNKEAYWWQFLQKECDKGKSLHNLKVDDMGSLGRLTFMTMQRIRDGKGE